MKKVFIIVCMIMTLFTNSLSFATSEETLENSEDIYVEETDKQDKKQESEEDVTPAAKKILNNASKKDRKIAEYTDKYGDKAYATTAYYLELIQLYSIPVCFIGLSIGALNYYIIGQKKLDKREQGFGFIVAFLCGFVFFQALPLIFALLVAGK